MLTMEIQIPKHKTYLNNIRIIIIQKKITINSAQNSSEHIGKIYFRYFKASRDMNELLKQIKLFTS